MQYFLHNGNKMIFWQFYLDGKFYNYEWKKSTLIYNTNAEL